MSPLGPLIYAAVSLGLIVTMAAARYIPARHMMTVDPVEALLPE